MNKKWTKLPANFYTNPLPQGGTPVDDLPPDFKIPPRHSAWFRKTGDGPWTVSLVDLSKCVEPRIPWYRRFWLWLKRPYMTWKYMRIYSRGVIIMRGDDNGSGIRIESSSRK
jgi:hypothetical protein